MRTVKDVFADRTCYKYTDKAVSLELLQEIYDTMKLGPTSANSCPLRIIFIESQDQKEKLLKCLMEGNVEKTKSAPVVAIFAYDTKFYTKMDKTHPISPVMKNYFASSEAIALDTANRNSTLQAAYFMIVARSLGLDCGPMSGLDAGAIEKEFLSGTGFKVNFVCNLGYRDGDNPFPRLPRLDFAEVCKIV
ncbi:Nitroreductase family protein [Candidatus Megaera venefica]|uniref:Nitroreductase family protein n=1 Tax=Candidatus Megaera venefica TaxID=2055910 RepID=A0ABU5NDS6_9RICK|nr:malonic semialdehyde reductase [Candidatus Megaera venefica]MEA0971341.1 Nitroreductase family protein [Candidatus Megaera venefica]